MHRLEEGAHLWGILPKKFPVYTDILESAGYFVGYGGKGWGPGTLVGSGRTRNPAGPEFPNFGQFLSEKPPDRPFCYWLGSKHPHRPYVQGSGRAAGMKLTDVVVPAFLPDTPAVRSDLLDYYFAIQRYDREVGEVIRSLETLGQLDNTLVVLTGDNGMAYPRAKANLYDPGTHVPLAMRWPAGFGAGRVIDDFASLCDLAPTFLEAAGLKPLSEATGRSLLGLIDRKERGAREMVFVERERHANARMGDASYPSRAVRTRAFLYIRNMKPDRWPVGDPDRRRAFADTEDSPARLVLTEGREDPRYARLFRLGFDRRAEEELYDLAKDPHELDNLAGRMEYAATKRKLRAALDQWMKETRDPRALGAGDEWDRYPFVYGKPGSDFSPKSLP